jgi:uncharacterized protein (UPF0210 family)
MQVRAITVGARVAFTSGTVHLDDRLLAFGQLARRRFAAAGLELQTLRLASQPFPEVVPAEREVVVAFAHGLEQAGLAVGYEYVSLGPAGPEQLGWVPALAEALVVSDRVFGTVAVADRDRGLSLPAVAAAASVVRVLAERTADGFGNLRFAALANCPPGIPFFPAGYHRGARPAFSVAWEAADLAVAACRDAGSLERAENRLVELVTREASRIASIAALLAEETDVQFSGIDISLAPYPEDARSIGEAIEQLGVDRFGAPGTLFAASLITRALQRAEVPKTGFSGLMLPVLEDSVLARRAAEGAFSVHDLLLWSAVCGVGLDVVPLPGDVREDELRALILDVAALAMRLDKPLTARLMPLPGKQAGDPVAFAFPYFAPSVVLPVRGAGAPRLFAREGV